jgi:hypothetical protein
MAAQAPAEQKSACSQAVLDAIHGKKSAEEKKAEYDRSLGSWWKEYAARKNDEEEEHVADSLLYDERCHLPRSAPRPAVVPGEDQKTYANTEAGAESANAGQE